MTKILAIEDEVPILENIVETLEIEGFEVYGAANGIFGVQAARQQLPDLIICDIMMPELDGYGVLLELRSDPLTSTIPFIFLTARADRAAMRQGMELGANDYLTKPFTATELIAAVNARLKQKAISDEKYQQQIDTLRNNMIHALPHELRTPLTGIIGCADFMMLDHEVMEPKRVYMMSEIIYRSAKRLQRLIENYLLYAQLELMLTDKERLRTLRLHHTDFASGIIMQTAMQRAEQLERSADITLDVHDAHVAAAEENLVKVIDELVDNGLKFSQPGVPVVITGRIVNDQYEITVQDHGRGMSAEQIRSIGAYIQFERALYEQQGLGMGLIIAKRITEIQGGTFTISSQKEQGTTITIALPLHKVPASV
jgi:signal transduction histidine kinase